MKNWFVPERLAARFTRANSEYLSRANHVNFAGHANGWWIALWFYLEQLPSAVADTMCLWSTEAAGSGVLIRITHAADEIYVHAYGAVSDNNKKFSVKPVAGKWHFVYCDYDTVNLRIQLDDNTIEGAGYTDYVASAQALNLGRSVNSATDYLDGRLQCVMCGHPNILTAAEIAWLYSESPKFQTNEGTPAVGWANEFYEMVYETGGGYGNGTGIPAKCTAAWALGEESVGVGSVIRGGTLNLTDNNTVTSARGLQP